MIFVTSAMDSTTDQVYPYLGVVLVILANIYIMYISKTSVGTEINVSCLCPEFSYSSVLIQDIFMRYFHEISL